MCKTAHRKVKALLVFAFAAALSARGDITYHLNFDPANSPEEQQVANSVAAAAAFYNQHGSFNKHWNVYYNPGIPTAEANYDGYMGFGNNRNERVVFHEAAHTFGMGTHSAYWGLLSNGVWTGKYGNRAQAESYNAYNDGLHGDGHAIWPGGFNYDNEDGFVNRLHHIRVMAGIRADLGLLSFTREPRNQAVAVGETAELTVESPMAASWQWYKNGEILPDSGRVSGATSPTLRIANAVAGDAGTYRCVVTGAGETLWSRPRELWINPASQLGRWTFDGNANDSSGSNDGTTSGLVTYAPGTSGLAVSLNGFGYVTLPAAVGRSRDTTIATWVYWNGGGGWQRIFDFGTGTTQYLFLTPDTGGSGGGLRLALKDPFLGRDMEYQVNSPALPTGQWVHLAVVLRDHYMTLYLNGQVVGSFFGVPSAPADFPASNNYIGKSQFSSDPLLNGRIDDFQVHARAFTGAEVWSLWGQSTDHAPVFSQDVITLPPANALHPYTGQSLASHASDPDGDPLTFSKLDGPAWLTVATDGTLGGTPGTGDLGENTFVIRVADPSGATSDATVKIDVSVPAPIPVTSTLTAPPADADDASFFASDIAEPDTIDGTPDSGSNDESTYLSEDRSSKGQTFTTGSNPQGYLLQSFTVQHVNWPTLTPNGTFHDVQPGDQWEFEIGSMSGNTKSPLDRFSAAYDGPAFTGSGTTGTGRHLTFNVSGLGIQLPPDTVCYFEIAPLFGDPFFELNSSRNSTYSGGTAFRGDTNGTIGSTVTPLDGDFVFHADLVAKTPAAPGTVAWWTFEEGVADTPVPYARGSAGRYQGSIVDHSGNANHLSVWAADWHVYRAQVPAPTTPQSGQPNTLSLENGNAYPAISSTSTNLRNWSPTAWTIEAAIRPANATNGFQTFIGRDSRDGFAGDPALAAMYFGTLPNGGLRFMFTDAAGNNWDLTSTANAIQSNKWQAVAATSNGSVLSIYRKNLSDGEETYTLLGTLDISSSTNPALSTGTGGGNDWEAGDFTVARGLYNGSHSDRFIGHIDDIRFSQQANAPDQFLYSTAPPTPSGLSATATSGTRIDLAWNASAGATGYQVKRSSNPAGPFTSIATNLATNNFADDSLSNGTTRYYVVTAGNAAGQSADSANANATTWTASEAWRMENFGGTSNTGNAADHEDPDKDGLDNLLEYALGTDPNGSNSGAAPRSDTTTGKLKLTFTRNAAATDLTLSVTAADDLAATWSELARSKNGAPLTAIDPAAVVNESGTGTVKNVETTDIHLTTDPAHPKRFMRLEVTR